MSKRFAQSKTFSTFAAHFEENAGIKEVWVSGWNQQFAKLPYGLPYRGFESPSFRNRISFQGMIKLVDSSSG